MTRPYLCLHRLLIHPGLLVWLYTLTTPLAGQDLALQHVIAGDIFPKSIVHNGHGRFLAQNMMYRHSITVYDRNFRLLETIPDAVRLADFGVLGYHGLHRGSPVEACCTADGTYAYVSNYQMYGPGFAQPGSDDCSGDESSDPSFLYRIDLRRLRIDQIIPVGSVPKYLALSPDQRYLLVSNWCSQDLSIIDPRTQRELRRVPLGRYPRGIAIDSKSRFAYVALMGEDRLAVINLTQPEADPTWIDGLPRTPRHLCLGPSDRYLYISCSRPGLVLKYDLVKGYIAESVRTGREARSMVLSPQGRSLYVVNYGDDTMTKVRTDSMQVVQTVATRTKPIGITFDAATRQVWVACYSGAIMVFRDQGYLPPPHLVLRDHRGPLPLAGYRPPIFTHAPGAAPHYPEPLYYLRRQADPSPASKGPLLAQPQAPPSGAAYQRLARPGTTSPYRYFIVVGSYTDSTRATRHTDRLRAQGLPAQMYAEDGRYRVCSHHFQQAAPAQARLPEVQRTLQPEAWIWKKPSDERPSPR